MTNDELLALYLDNSLTSAQRQDFETLLQTSPEFVQEARELSALQNMLALPLPNDERTNAFLRGMENNIAASIIAAGAATATSVATSALAAKSGLGASGIGAAASTSLWSSLVTSVSSNVVGASIAAATILGGGAAVTYLAVNKSTPQESARQEAIAPAQSQTTPASGVNAQRQATENTESSQTASNTAITTLPGDAPTSTASKATPSSEARPATEYSARISGGAAMNGRYAASIQEYTRQMQEKEAAGDRIGTALVEKSLGALLRQAGDFAQSRKHLRNVLSTAQALTMKELEGEATGELALIFLAEGNKAKAEEMLHNAVTMLTAAQSRSVARWQQELDKLTTNNH